MRRPSGARLIASAEAHELLPERPVGAQDEGVKKLTLGTVAALVVVLCATSAAAVTGQPIGANQAFVGRVNGSFDRATIKMACFGPIRQGQTGHPMSGQTLEVLSPPPPIVVGPIHPGYTGASATRIVAVLRGDTPVVLARFTRYFTGQAIPTNVELPCAGSGVVRFVPKPRSFTSKAAWVTVSFLGQP
jgi:hypothetical protein